VPENGREDDWAEGGGETPTSNTTRPLPEKTRYSPARSFTLTIGVAGKGTDLGQGTHRLLKPSPCIRADV